MLEGWPLVALNKAKPFAAVIRLCGRLYLPKKSWQWNLIIRKTKFLGPNQNSVFAIMVVWRVAEYWVGVFKCDNKWTFSLCLIWQPVSQFTSPACIRIHIPTHKNSSDDFLHEITYHRFPALCQPLSISFVEQFAFVLNIIRYQLVWTTYRLKLAAGPAVNTIRISSGRWMNDLVQAADFIFFMCFFPLTQLYSKINF